MIYFEATIKGIGESIARGFAEYGAKVIISSRKQDAVDAVAASFKKDGLEATGIACHVGDESQLKNLVAKTTEIYGGIDILVNNAGIAHVGNIEGTTEADLDRIYGVNIKGVYNCAFAVVKHMKSRGGVVLNLASIASSVGITDRFAYSMSKGAVLTMTYSIAKDYLKQGIRCNSISPARVHTPFVDGFIKANYPGKEEEMFEKLSKTQPIGRMGTPAEVANLALYLCSDEASFITGTDFPIDGGFIKLNG